MPAFPADNPLLSQRVRFGDGANRNNAWLNRAHTFESNNAVRFFPKDQNRIDVGAGARGCHHAGAGTCKRPACIRERSQIGRADEAHLLDGTNLIR